MESTVNQTALLFFLHVSPRKALLICDAAHQKGDFEGKVKFEIIF